MAVASEVAVDREKTGASWIAAFQRYAAQNNIEVEGDFTARQGGTPSLPLSDLLRTLSEPQNWAHLRRTLSEATAALPGDQPRAKQQLQAGSWLLAYLAGDRAVLEQEIAAVAAQSTQENYAVRDALRLLRVAVPGESSTEMSLKAEVEVFEQQLARVGPVDKTALKRALGGEENFARLERLAEANRELQLRLLEIQKEHATDPTAAQTKRTALQKEYTAKVAADQLALVPFMKDPLVTRALMDVFRGGVGTTNRYVTTLYVPDLVAALGRDRAAELLRQALQANAKLHLHYHVSPATRQLTRELALAEIATIQTPSWGLVRDAQSADLFEAFQRKFPRASTTDYEYREACGYYLAGLIQQRRSDEAVEFATRTKVAAGEQPLNLPYEVMSDLERDRPEELWKFLHGWLAAKATSHEWERLTRLSVQLDRSAELKALIKTLAADNSLRGAERLAVQRLETNAEMATGETVAAAERLRALLKIPGATQEERLAQMDVATRLLTLAHLQNDNDSLVSALALAEAVIEKSFKDRIDVLITGIRGLTSTLNTLGHHVEASRVARGVLSRISELEKAAAAKSADLESSSWPNTMFKDVLAEQLYAEVALAHWPEALALLQENAWWNEADASGLLTQTVDSSKKPVGYYIALVARSQSDSSRTRRILEAQLVAKPGSDSAYEAYLALVGQEALPLLEKLTVADRYEERPLIWKARLQMDARQWDAAIATLQQAIGIDPSDGEQGPGDRMRVYAFMSTAVAAKGDAVKAAFFADVVKSIRLSETADRWHEIGAYTHAIKLYQEALGFFRDAYCIQSRLAVRLADAGKLDEAAEHYRRAFELMPDSFGRVESHCFGCEHVFAGKKSQGVAEDVFARMLQARPDKPQLHYLYGYLRQEQERLPEAAEHYRRAVQLDPLYLNAWNRLAGLDRELKFSPEQRDDLLLKLVELDPARRHVSPDLKNVRDLPRLWRALKASEQVLAVLPHPAALWELKASAARLAKDQERGTASSSKWNSRNDREDFATVLLDHAFVRALQTYLDAVNRVPAETP